MLKITLLGYDKVLGKHIGPGPGPGKSCYFFVNKRMVTLL